MEINELVKKAHFIARSKGFWQNEDVAACVLQKPLDNATNDAVKKAFQAQRLMLIVSELGEALEALREGNKENFAEELADTCIRIFDLCGGYGIDIETAIKDKMATNEARPPKHGKAF